jgi:hypothetical protein
MKVFQSVYLTEMVRVPARHITDRQTKNELLHLNGCQNESVQERKISRKARDPAE